MALLAQLIQLRLRDPYLTSGVLMPDPRPPSVVIAPFANERVREWQASRFRELIEAILRLEGYPVTVVGTGAQRPGRTKLSAACHPTKSAMLAVLSPGATCWL